MAEECLDVVQGNAVLHQPRRGRVPHDPGRENAAGYPGTPYVEWYPQCGTSGEPDDEFVEVPTGGAVALMSMWYLQQEDTVLYATLYSIDPGSKPDGVWLFNTSWGNEDYRTWYFPATPPPPAEVSPSPSASLPRLHLRLVR